MSKGRQLPPEPEDYEDVMISIIRGDALLVDRHPWRYRASYGCVGVAIYIEIPRMGYCQISEVRIENQEWVIDAVYPEGRKEMHRKKINKSSKMALAKIGVEIANEHD